MKANNGFAPLGLYPRLLHFGVQYGDLNRITTQARDWPEWCAGLARCAEHYRESAEHAASQESAAHFWRLAAIYFHYAQIRIPVSPTKTQYRQESAAAFRRFQRLASDRVRRHDVRVGFEKLPGYRLGADADAPLVILVGGLDSAKEVELYSFARCFADRGLQCYVFDGPGQGELFGESPLELRFERVLSGVIDHFQTMAGIRSIGVFGVSLGGFLAARAAAADERIQACLSLGGFYEARTLHKLSPFGAELLRASLQLEPDAPLHELTDSLSVDAAAGSFTRPLLVLHGTADHLVDDEQIRLFEQWTRCPKNIRRVEGAEHVCTDRFADVSTLR